MEKDNLAVLIVSCDKYADLWNPFFKMFRIFWTQCIYPVYLGSNNVLCDEPGVKTICIGEDKSWTENVKKMLDGVSETHVIMLLEDFFLEEAVDAKGVQALFEYAVENDVDCLRLCPTPPPNNIVDKNLQVGTISKGAPYCCSTQPAIWKKEALQSLLIPGYSAWDFEKKNSQNMRYSPLKLMGSKRFYVKRHNGVERGKFYTSTLQLLKRNDIQVDITERGIIDDLSLKHRIYAKIYQMIQNIRSKLAKDK